MKIHTYIMPKIKKKIIKFILRLQLLFLFVLQYYNQLLYNTNCVLFLCILCNFYFIYLLVDAYKAMRNINIYVKKLYQ